MTYDKRYYSGTFYPSLFRKGFTYIVFQALFYFFYGIEKLKEQFSSTSKPNSYALRALRRVFRLLQGLIKPSLKTTRQPFLSIVTRSFRTDHQGVVFGDPKRLRHGVWTGLSYTNSKRMVLYVHGGGYISGDIAGFLPIVDKLATVLQCPVFLPEYSLVPEHCVVEAVEDLVYALEHALEHSCSTCQICICGDSAGGGLSLLLINEWIVQKGSKSPIDKCVVWSPMMDLTASGETVQHNMNRDPYLTVASVQYCARLAFDPLLPSYSEIDWVKFPETRVVASEDEILLSDSLRLGDCLKQSILDIYPESIHAFPLFWEYIPEAEQELYKMAQFLNE